MGVAPALVLAAIVIVAVAAAAVVLSYRQKRDDASLPVLDSVSRTLGQLQSELARLGRNQEELRQDIQRGREASILQLSETAKGLHGEISQAQRALAEVKALEQGRARQLEQASDSLKRLEAVVAGSSTRGTAGENILARALAQLPPDLLEINLAFRSRIVPYSLALPYVLALYRLTVRFGCAVDTDQLAARLRALEETLHRSADEVESRLSRGLVQAENARDALRDHLLEARRATERLLQTAGDEPPSAALPAHLPVLMVGERD